MIVVGVVVLTIGGRLRVELGQHRAENPAPALREAPESSPGLPAPCPARLQDEDVSVNFAEVTEPGDRVAVVVTEPLTADEAWIAFAPGELKVFVDGEPLANT